MDTIIPVEEQLEQQEKLCTIGKIHESVMNRWFTKEQINTHPPLMGEGQGGGYFRSNSAC